jgi:hypothetical protein
MVENVCSALEEIYKISLEIKEANKKLKSLRDRKKELEQDVINYLEETDQPAVKYKNIVVISDQGEKRKRKKKKDKETDCIKTLKALGVNNPKDAFEKILESMRGEKTSITKLKLKNI